jgi:hypothetical protein
LLLLLLLLRLRLLRLIVAAQRAALRQQLLRCGDCHADIWRCCCCRRNRRLRCCVYIAARSADIAAAARGTVCCRCRRQQRVASCGTRRGDAPTHVLLEAVQWERKGGGAQRRQQRARRRGAVALAHAVHRRPRQSRHVAAVGFSGCWRSSSGSSSSGSGRGVIAAKHAKSGASVHVWRLREASRRQRYEQQPPPRHFPRAL